MYNSFPRPCRGKVGMGGEPNSDPITSRSAISSETCKRCRIDASYGNR